MAYCANCGKQIVEGAKFCINCGSPVTTYVNNQTKREAVYEGKIHKCPSCGDVLEPFETKCNVCGYVLRSVNATSSVKEFEVKFEQVQSVNKKIDLIKTFAVPNAQEDLLEFAVLAAMNIDLDAYKTRGENMDDIRLSNAWLAKLEQAHEKAQVLFDNTPIWSKIDRLYQKRMKALSEIKRKYNRNRALSGIVRILVKVYKTVIGWGITFMLVGGFFYLLGDTTVGMILFAIGVYVGFFALILAATKKSKD